jgi:hypothetical protein
MFIQEQNTTPPTSLKQEVSFTYILSELSNSHIAIQENLEQIREQLSKLGCYFEESGPTGETGRSTMPPSSIKYELMQQEVKANNLRIVSSILLNSLTQII